MKTDTFKSNGLIVERRETREGPSPYFVVYYKNVSRITTDVKSIKKRLKLGRGTNTMQQLDEWLESFSAKAVALEIQQTTEHVADAA